MRWASQAAQICPLTVHKLSADGDPVLHKERAVERDDVRRVALKKGKGKVVSFQEQSAHF